MKFAAALLFAAPLIAGSIEGRVTNGVTGEPVAGANVRFLDRHSYVFRTVTDASGAYRINDLADGEYQGEVASAGFSDYRQGASFQDMASGGVRVSGDVPAHFDMQLQPWARLRGRVIDEDGNPAAGVLVEISLRVDGAATTDANGNFTFEELRPGSYTVAAKPEARTRMRDGEKVGTVPIYYPSATRPAEASLINVAWGQTLAGIDIRLKSVPVHRVAGVVLDANGKPAAHATVKLLGQASENRREFYMGMVVFAPMSALHYTSGPALEPELASIESRQDGTFEFPAVEPGEWRLAADTDPDEKPRSGVTPVSVGDKDVADVQIRMSGPFSVQVTADWGDASPQKPKDGGPVSTAPLVHLAAEEGQPQQAFDPAANVTSVAGLFPGRYRVMSTSMQGTYYAGAVMFEGRDVLGQTVELAPGAGPLHVMVRHDGGTVRGTVQEGRCAIVFLIPKTSGQVSDYVSVPCGPGGTFEIGNVAPGAYYVVAFDHGGSLPPESLPGSIMTMAEETKVDPGSAGLPLNVRLNKWPW